jgi:hypothetical protein
LAYFPMKRIKLTRKLAPLLNGVDLSRARVGDVLLLPEATANMVIAEGWAEPLPTPPVAPASAGPTLKPRNPDDNL